MLGPGTKGDANKPNKYLDGWDCYISQSQDGIIMTLHQIDVNLIFFVNIR